MRLRYTSVIFILALLLLVNSAASTTCAIFVTNEFKMTVNDAKIYIDDSSQPIGVTAYNTGVGQHCWVGEIDMNGTHTLTAKWVKSKPSRVAHEGSIVVEFTGEARKTIYIPTHKV